MPKTKKKHNPISNQKLINAQHRNEFLKKISCTCKAILGEDLFKLIPSKDYERIIFLRARPILAVPEEGQSIPPKILEAIQGLINYFIKIVMMPVETSQKPISIADFYTTGLTISIYCRHLEDSKNKNKNIDRVISLISNSCLEFEQQFDIVFDKLNDELYPFLIRSTNIFWARYYSYSLITSNSKDNVGIQYRIVVKPYPPEKKKFLIEGNLRPAFRIGWTFKNNEFEWIYMLPSQLGIKSLPEHQQIPVYIQSHAIQRIFERIDCIHINVIIPSIYLSLRECVSIIDRGKFIINIKTTSFGGGHV